MSRFVFGALWSLFLLGSVSSAQTLSPGPVSADGKYVLVGWNTLGMHCINGRFNDMCILPPANFIQATVIRRAGEEPQAVTQNMRITYEMPTNQFVQNHTNFWQFVNPLFGVNLQPGIGLAGFGTSGTMAPMQGYFEASAVPAIPISDNGTWNPYQSAILKLYDSTNQLKAQARIVVPVSDELNCQKCHSSGGVAAKGISMPTLEQNILTLHDLRNHTNLMNQRPVLCSKCHSDNALNLPGVAGVESLSLAMHRKHSTLTNQPACYDCHPGANTQCNRSALPKMGPSSPTQPNCQNCHGTLVTMAKGLIGGRKPWLQEPACTKCHGTQVSTGTTLYRQARGHGGLLCITCHNSPHAWWPSKNAADNELPISIQGNNHALGYNNCKVCHTDGRQGVMPPHGGDD